ncbi:COG4315 family predicted lipoprotein [Nocardioides nematodiphilus]|uniref:COG4315 family predicted lipoprotein n=1 Tax=Nocardioides nematodiphilus TaxID=2849669 RepID=UPI001CD9AB17|nr:hypothetical protein [Nocardioides nematodiphilus]MCA1983226.1 hypothetical protein [Nocardioides nematodiphilus]
MIRTDIRRPASRRLALPAVAMAAVAVLAACGSTSNNATAGGGGATASGSSGDGEAETIGTASGGYGTYLTADDGRAVYLWMADKGSTSSCSGACATVWPPVLTDGAPKATQSAVAADLGTTTRSDGKTQVTYQGHPLYYFASDTKAGQTSGQGSDGFGAKWWLLTPAGAAITSDAGGSSPAGGSNGY